MKTIKNLVLVAVFAFSTVLSASNPTTSKSENSRLSYEIQKFLTNHDFDFKNEVTAEVMITLNKDHEIVVLSVDHDNPRIENYIKSKLNYKKLSSEYLGKDKKFIVPVKLMPQS